MATGLNKVVEHLHRVVPIPGGLADDHCLARFVGRRDQAAFTAIVRRHGPMVLGVCRRVLGDHHDAEDAFQATFLVLARKAAAVRRQALGSWLYAVAYRTSLEARAVKARRQSRERTVEQLPEPTQSPREPRDWIVLLDRELHSLPESYRAALVLCDLEGWPRKEAARQLRTPEGTLSSRLARARALLARRLKRHGVTLSAAAVASLLAQSASASVPIHLVASTSSAAALVVAGQAAALSTPAALLMKGVMNAMLIAKLRVVVGTGLILAALATCGIAYHTGSLQAAPPDGKPLSEMEGLRRENELLKLNLQVVLEKVRAQEAELRELRKSSTPVPVLQDRLHPYRKELPDNRLGIPLHRSENLYLDAFDREGSAQRFEITVDPNTPYREVEKLLKAIRNAEGRDATQRAIDDLEKAFLQIKERPSGTNLHRK